MSWVGVLDIAGSWAAPLGCIGASSTHHPKLWQLKLFPNISKCPQEVAKWARLSEPHYSRCCWKPRSSPSKQDRKQKPQTLWWHNATCSQGDSSFPDHWRVNIIWEMKRLLFVKKTRCSEYVENQCHPTMFFYVTIMSISHMSLALVSGRRGQGTFGSIIMKNDSSEPSLKCSHLWIVTWQLISSFLLYPLRFNLWIIKRGCVAIETF